MIFDYYELFVWDFVSFCAFFGSAGLDFNGLFCKSVILSDNCSSLWFCIVI